jgi:hypothetical protein
MPVLAEAAFPFEAVRRAQAAKDGRSLVDVDDFVEGNIPQTSGMKPLGWIGPAWLTNMIPLPSLIPVVRYFGRAMAAWRCPCRRAD